MAAWNGRGDGEKTLPSPSVKQVPSPENIQPDTEQNVCDEAEDVFKNFLYQSWRQDQSRQDFDNTPNVPQLTNFTADPLGPAAQVGRQLAKIGDDINQRYQPEFDQMINSLNINQATAYDAFAGVAKKLLAGGVNWGRILTLFSFGYRIAVRVLQLGERIGDFAQTLKNIVTNVVTFIRDTSQGIAHWIASQGGWRSGLTYVPTLTIRQWAAFIGFSILTVGGVIYFRS